MTWSHGAGKCCWSRWGSQATCGGYPDGGQGGLCSNDFSKSCFSNPECKDVSGGGEKEKAKAAKEKAAKEKAAKRKAAKEKAAKEKAAKEKSKSVGKGSEGD